MLTNWTKATTTTTGTGTLTLAAVTGRPLPSKSKVIGEYVQYTIVTSDSKYESGIGKIAAGDTLERSKVLSTYDGTTYNSTTATALSLASGTHAVYIAMIAETVFEPLLSPLTGLSTPSVSSAAGIVTISSATNALVYQRNCVFPFKLETAGLLTSMGVWVGTAGAAGTTFLLGLYEPKSDGKPGRLIAKTSATLDGASTGWKEQAVVSNVRLTPGWYWAACVVGAGASVPTLFGSDMCTSPFGNTSYSALLRIYDSSTVTDLGDPYPINSLTYSDKTIINYIPKISLILT